MVTVCCVCVDVVCAACAYVDVDSGPFWLILTVCVCLVGGVCESDCRWESTSDYPTRGRSLIRRDPEEVQLQGQTQIGVPVIYN